MVSLISGKNAMTVRLPPGRGGNSIFMFFNRIVFIFFSFTEK
jgi:hypothetical protein